MLYKWHGACLIKDKKEDSFHLISRLTRRGNMKKFLLFLCAVMLVLGMATSSSATSIYYEATGVSGSATITYGTFTNGDPDNPPAFSFWATAGSVDENLASFVPDEYSIGFTLDGFWADINEDGTPDFFLPDFSFTSGPYTIPALPPLSGTYGQLTWNFAPYSGGSASYDFGTTGITNSDVNIVLAALDSTYSGDHEANGFRMQTSAGIHCELS